MENVTFIENQKKEAVLRLRKLRILNDVIQQFKNDGTLHRSDNGILYWLTDEEKRNGKQMGKG